MLVVVCGALLSGCGARTGLPGETRTKLASPACRPDPGNPDRVVLSGAFRDFRDTHPDFEGPFIGEDQGIVESVLGADGKPVYAGQDGNPSTHGAVAFDQWYRDTPGVNLRKDTALSLAQSTSEANVYGFADDTFFPLDGELFGDEGRDHNFHFTLEAHGTFEYLGGELLGFAGDDDMWVFINGRLAIDLGGVHSTESAFIDLDERAGELELVRGEIAPVDLFFAERHTSGSTFDFSLRDFVVCE